MPRQSSSRASATSIPVAGTSRTHSDVVFHRSAIRPLAHASRSPSIPAPRRRSCPSSVSHTFSASTSIRPDSSGIRPSVNTPKSRTGNTYTAARGLYVWISDGCSQSAGEHPAIRACSPSNASRGAVSCNPTYAAARVSRSAVARPGC